MPPFNGSAIAQAVPITGPEQARESFQHFIKPRTASWLIVAALLIAAFGIGLRFASLDTKLFTNDEATTSLRVAGHQTVDYLATIDGTVRTAAQIAATMQGGARETSPLVVAKALAVEEPQHAPLYYVMERGWQNVVGNGVAARRALSAVAGSLLIVAAAWLAFELFGARAAAIVAALVAVSPFHFIYAQQAREYALWSLLATVVSALLVRGLRTNAPAIWAAYALGGVLGLYTDSLFLATLAAHAVAVACSSAWRRHWRPFAASIVFAVAAFGPWLWFLLDHARRGGINAVGSNTYLQAPLPWKLFAAKWVFQLGAVFFDSAYRWPALTAVALPIVGVALYALYRLVRGRIPGASFVVSLALVPSFMLIIPDVVLHQSRSTAARYLSPEWIALELAVGWLIASLLRSAGVRLRRLGVAVFAAFIAAGAFACIVQAGSEWSWADGSIRPIGPISRIIDAADARGDHPLIVWQAPFGAAGAPGEFDFSVVELSDVVAPDVRFQQFAWTMPVKPAVSTGTVYVLDPTDRLRHSMEADGYRLVLAYRADHPENGVNASMHREAASVRKESGFAEMTASLWQIEAAR